MAVNIELRVDGVLIGGAEEWWDDADAALTGHRTDYPLLARVDPYDVTTFDRHEIEDLRAEADRLATAGGASVRELAAKLMALCDEAMRHAVAELRFVGD